VVASAGDSIEKPEAMTPGLTGGNFETKHVTGKGLILVDDGRVGYDEGNSSQVQFGETVCGEKRHTRLMNERDNPIITEMACKVQVSDTYDDLGLEGIRI
jgi:hypothetical protein